MKHAAFILLILLFLSASTAEAQSLQLQPQFENLEKEFNGKIGVYALNTHNQQIIAYRAFERFPLQSTLKVIAVSALLKASHSKKNLLQEKINERTLETLSEAAITYSDNAAVNIIIQKLGGPTAITNFARSIGNKTFNIEHYDGELNSNPDNPQDTSTPHDMVMSLQKLMLGSILTKSEQTKLMTWMRNDTVGYKRIRLGVPMGWVVADKTGSGSYGVDNDIGMLWSRQCQPIIVAIYTVGKTPEAKKRDDMVVAVTNIIFAEFAKHDRCFNA